ncbi:MAG: DUF4349 domain-containing protein [Saprospiraceae bacterium]|nr:DUF4349 domain-containing protein [Saprospiraceae bacterium]
MHHHFRISLLPMLLISAFLALHACQQKSEAAFSDFAPPPPLQQSTVESETAPVAVQQFGDAASSGDLFSSSAARFSAVDSLKKFVRNADLRFRVKNTASATLQIEDIVLRHGGFVTSSQLNSATDLHHISPISRDSAIETTRYTVQTHLIVRVPCRQLDTVLRAIGRLSEYFEHRHVAAEDVELQMLDKELKMLREGIYRNALENSRENDQLPKADRDRDSRAAGDQARLEKLKLEDEIRYSTLRVAIYQPPLLRQTVVANTDVVLPQKPFAASCTDALHAGGEILVLIFLGIVHLWGLLLLLAVLFWALKWWGKRKPVSIGAAQKSA